MIKWFPSVLLAAAGIASTADAMCSVGNPTLNYPYPLQNGQSADASQVMADLDCAPIHGLANYNADVGVGTTTPNTTLDVAGQIGVADSGAYPENIYNGRLIAERPAASGQYINIIRTGNWVWSIGTVYNTSTFAIGMGTSTDSNFTSPFFSIAPNGNIGVGTGTPQSSLDVSGVVRIEAGQQLQFWNSAQSAGNSVQLDSGSSSTPGLSFNTGGAQHMVINFGGNVGIGTTSPSYLLTVNGAAYAQSWNVLSDARLKKDVTPITDALAVVEQLQGVRYRWRPVVEREVGKDLKLPLDEPQIGFIAQDVEKVVPEAVDAPKPGSNDVYSLKETKLIPVLVEAIKEEAATAKQQQAEIDELRGALAGSKASGN